MRVTKRILLGIINISASPHSKDGETYRSLLKAAFELGRPVRIRGDEFALIASCVEFHPAGGRSVLTGEIHKYTEITDNDWENIKNRRAATVEDLKELKIPDHLKPNRDSFRYFLFPQEHRLVVQLQGMRRNITHAAVKHLLEYLFSNPEIKKQFPMVSVTIESEPDSLERIIGLARLDRFYIEVERPNSGDSFEENEEQFVEDLLARQAAKTLKVELIHAPGHSLKPDKHNQRLARAATSYGKVIGKGRDERGRPTTIDTSDHPVAEPFDYEKRSKVSFVDQMFGVASNLVQKVRKRTKKPKDEHGPKE